MKTWALSLSLWSLLVGLAASDTTSEYLYKGDPDASAVIEHTAKTDFEKSSKPRLVEFYSPFCGGCRNFKPKYISMAEQINAKYADVEVYAVSCAPFKEICNKHKIKGYPSLYAFPAGATEGTYLQKSSMGGSYEITAIAETLKLSKGSSSKTTTAIKSKRSLAVASDDESAAKKVVETTLTKKTSLKKDDADSEESVKTTTKKDAASKKDKDSEDVVKKTVATKKTLAKKEEESDDVLKTTSKKTVTKKTVTKAAASEDEKESSKEDEDASTDKDTAIKKRQLVDEKEDEEKEEKISEDKDDEKDEKASEDKEDEKDEEASKEEKEDEKEDGKEEEISKDDEKEDDKKDEILKDDEKEEEISKDDEKEGDKEEEISKDDEKEEEDDKEEEISKDDQKVDTKDDKEEDTKDDKEEDKDEDSEEDKNDEDDKDGEKDTGDDKDDADEEEEETEDDKEDAAAEFRASAIRQPNSLGSPGALANRVVTGGAYKPGRHPGAGAQKAGLKERDMDRWKTIMEQRKKMMDAKRGSKMNFLRPLAATSTKTKGPGGKIQLAIPGKSGTTKVMRANTPGTQEFEERKKQILARIEKAKKKHGFPLLGSRSKAATTLVKKEMFPFKKEPKAPGLMRRGMESVPIVKRAFRMSPEEELILDASLSFVTGLKHGVFMSADSLTDKKKEALKSWLDLLSVSLPPEWGLHALIDDLSKNLNFVAKSNANLQKILSKHPSPRKFWSKSCDKRGTGGFSCGMWKLFHIVSLGVAEQHGGSNLIDSGLVSASVRTFSPADAADVVRDYMANFFGCDDCRKHFLDRYESCAFRRCDRLSDDASSASADDWKQLALWMWEVHNDVNIRVANKKVERLQTKLNSKHLQGAQTLKLSQKQEDEIKVLFPSLDDCVVCFDESGKWDEDSVFEYLERTYWDAPDAKFDRLLTYRKVEGEDPSGGGFVWIMMIIALCIVVSLRRHVNNISFHKHFQTASMTSVGNKIGDAVAGKKRTA